MALAKTHYRQVASVMQQAQETLRKYKGKQTGIPYTESNMVWAKAIKALADIYAKDNRNFDRAAFYKECSALTEYELSWIDLDKVEF